MAVPECKAIVYCIASTLAKRLNGQALFGGLVDTAFSERDQMQQHTLWGLALCSFTAQPV